MLLFQEIIQFQVRTATTLTVALITGAAKFTANAAEMAGAVSQQQSTWLRDLSTTSSPMFSSDANDIVLCGQALLDETREMSDIAKRFMDATFKTAMKEAPANSCEDVASKEAA